MASTHTLSPYTMRQTESKRDDQRNEFANVETMKVMQIENELGSKDDPTYPFLVKK